MVEGLVSTIIPVFNRPQRLVEAVNSVLAQDYRPVEIIIVDDGSTDETATVAERLASEHREVRVVRRANGGPGRARETGRSQVQGEFIQHLDSDDLLLPGKFSAQVAGLRARPECGVSYGWTQYRRADGTLDQARWKPTGHEACKLFPSFLRERWWETATPLFRRQVCDEVGPWSEQWLEEDWEYDCRVAALGVTLHYVPAFVAEHHHHGEARLSGAGPKPEVLAQRARSHELILAHAHRAGLGPDLPEMQHFARALFLLARQCGAAGLAKESGRLFDLARNASGERGGGADFRLYRAAATLLGWRLTGRLACWRDHLRD